MDKRRKLLIGAIGAVAVIGAGAGVGIAAGGDDDRPLRGSAYDRATAAALAHVGKGTVTEAESEDGGNTYEVEIRLRDGSEVEVQLDSSFEVTGTEGDDDGTGDTGEAGDD
jgi:hypothetical protein